MFIELEDWLSCSLESTDNGWAVAEARRLAELQLILLAQARGGGGGWVGGLNTKYLTKYFRYPEI